MRNKQIFTWLLSSLPQGVSLKRSPGSPRIAIEAGKTYYFRTRLIGGQKQQLIDMMPIDSDLATYLMSPQALSASHPKPWVAWLLSGFLAYDRDFRKRPDSVDPGDHP